jgi:uncharacterized coiled-coil protein SlyX
VSREAFVLGREIAAGRRHGAGWYVLLTAWWLVWAVVGLTMMTRFELVRAQSAPSSRMEETVDRMRSDFDRTVPALAVQVDAQSKVVDRHETQLRELAAGMQEIQTIKTMLYVIGSLVLSLVGGVAVPVWSSLRALRAAQGGT